MTEQTSKILELADSLTVDKDKETHMKEYITSVKALEDAMEPFKEQKRELRKEYDDNGWLNKDEQRMVVRAYRLLKDDIDIGELIDMYDALRGTK
tara:strand:- start:111 stop:395 length:285 start_codon:yes stop_codon:yes gene_type:complete